ncbi:SagB/ThcOx family dehydrogenase [Actinomyces ruminicola]|uniref:SagB/ThcOx family dehydrogenase n=1 Tax=Actinomyces ruminicola TaxID=332524 RepID=UPI00164FFE9E
MTLSTLFATRRSPEAFAFGRFTTQDLANWCWIAAGQTATVGGIYEGRTYPSGGALFPCDLFLALDAGPDWDAGTYLYQSSTHELVLMGREPITSVAETTPQAELFEYSAVVWIIVASLWRNRFKYGQRALRFTMIEAGHMAQNICLGVRTSGHEARCVGGYYDDELADLLHFDSLHEVPIYMIVSGIPATTSLT